MSFDVRQFEGTPEDLAEFVVSAWKATYAGQMAVPLWSADYFRWQLNLNAADDCGLQFCAYHHQEPAGVMLGIPTTVDLNGVHYEGLQASWLSVPTKFRGQGVAAALNSAVTEYQRKSGRVLRIGYGYFGSTASLARRFWTKDHRTQTLRQVGFWVRILDARRAAAWNVSRLESALTGLASPLLKPPRVRIPAGVTIRPVNDGDLDTCLDLVSDCTDDCRLKIVWNRSRLRRQLGLEGFSRTLVAECEGRVAGFICYHILPMLGRTEEPVGIIDLTAVRGLTGKARTALLNSVLVDLQQSGAILALKLRSGDYPATTFLQIGWTWKPADSDLLLNWPEPSASTLPIRKFHLLWR
ncbi:MAG: hypothetical protein R3C49_00155 [Planctomycetaceae bacterium]